MPKLPPPPPPPQTSTTNLLMTATKQSFESYQQQQQQQVSGCHDGSIEAGGASSDGGESAELKQRKKEFILAKQLERRQQQEAIRQKREEERARKAEEMRQKEEEAAMKKLVEKTRKETIFQAYIDKKKQLQDESLTNYFGHPSSSLLSSKSKFHSTQRLKSSGTKQSAAQAHQHFAFDLKQNLLMDQYDQASIISDRSTSTTQPCQMKSKYSCAVVLFRRCPPPPTHPKFQHTFSSPFSSCLWQTGLVFFVLLYFIYCCWCCKSVLRVLLSI